MRAVRNAATACALFVCVAAAFFGATPQDPVAVEIGRWSDFIAGNPSTDPLWIQVRDSSQPMLESAAEALRDGRRLLALQRLAAASANLGGSAYLAQRSTQSLADAAAFEAEWKRMGAVLRAELAPPSRSTLASVRPAAARALGEVALLQVRSFYEMAPEYGQNTMAAYGLFYVGVAQAQSDFVAWTRTLEEASARTAPPLRSVSGELDRLEDEMLAAYRPPASIEKHAAFIGASSSLKEARELDAVGLHAGALYKYLQAAARFAILQAPSGPIDTEVVRARLDQLSARLAQGDTDNSIGTLFLEIAQADLAAKTGEPPATAQAVACDVLDRYFEALAPARRAAPKPPAAVTVTLVRWPYT